MTTIPPECRQEEARVSELKRQHNDLAGRVNATTGAPVWPLLAQLGAIKRQLAVAEAALQSCIAKPPAVVGEVITIDALASVTMGPARCTLWDLAGSGPVQVEQCDVEEERIAFGSRLPDRAALTAEADQGDGVPRVYLRSGVIEHHAGPLRLEGVVCPTLTLTAGELARLLGSLVPIEAPINAGGVELTLKVTGLTPALGPDVLGVAILGSLGSGPLPGLPAADAQLTGIVRGQLRPDVSPDARRSLIVTPVAGGSALQLSGSLTAAIAGALVPVVLPFVEARVLNQAQDQVDAALTQCVRQALMLADLPGVLTVRSCRVDETGVIVAPTLTGLGTALSAFDPSPIGML